ncbi:MAG: class I mannose-6-phosphate isomerase [Clostridia bacterium]|nr:class I mannose-6-phosphate isomerase [Clostridia bacterium]
MSYPMKLVPATVEAVWGGTRLMNDKWNKKGLGANIAESWELACHEKGESIVVNGEFSSRKLSSVLEENPQFLGAKGKEFSFFPILVKLIDSKSNLSIQVHPDDEYALREEGEYGKTEMWYIVDAKKGSGVYCGFKEPISKEQLGQALAEGKITDYLNFIEVQKGDCLFIPAGTVHAICGGILLCEVQQNSSITYRLYDYDRVDDKGNKRALHIDKALDVTDTAKVVKANENSVRVDDNTVTLASCKYFTASEITCEEEYTFEVGEDSFVSLTVVDGSGAIMADGNCISLDLGDTVFLPAGLGKVNIYGNLKAISAKV